MQVVTGATGHVGNVLVRTLLDRGASDVRALVGPSGITTSLFGLDVEMVAADVRDHDALVKVFAGADVVYHTAGIISIATSGLGRLRHTNVEGTRNVLAACKKAGVRRLVYTSSVHALVEPPRGSCLDESFAIDPASVRGPYAKTKAEATCLAMEAAGDGQDVVVTFPSGIVGPYDFRPSFFGRFILDCARGRMKAYVNGGYNFVDVRDVAQGLIDAAEKGRSGEGYLMSGHEVTVVELIQAVASITGVPSPRWRFPFGFTRAVSFAMPAYYGIRREQPLFTSYSLDVIASNSCMSSAKAGRELGFEPRPLLRTLEDTVAWFDQEGYLAHRGRAGRH